LAGSTNFETFMGGNELADTKKVGQNLRGVFNDSDALVNSQALKRTKYVITDCPELREEDEEDGSRSSDEEDSKDLVEKIQ
jgi:hypothetical protein